jgi:hypothetical protein
MQLSIGTYERPSVSLQHQLLESFLHNPLNSRTSESQKPIYKFIYKNKNNEPTACTYRLMMMKIRQAYDHPHLLLSSKG